MTISAALATSCGRYDCGHVGRSDNRDLKRAAFLYLAESAGVRGVMTDHESAATMAALGLMRQGEACELVAQTVRWTDDEGRRRQRTERVAPERGPVKLTEGQAQVLRYVREGYDIPEIAAAMTLTVQTVRSHMGNARKATRTHSTLDAAVEATRLDLI